MSKHLSAALENGVAFLRREQEPDGSFMCLVSTIFDDYSDARIVPAIVPTNIVLSSLRYLTDCDDIKNKAADFLLQEKNDFWSFNYWFRRSDWYTMEPYPDDIDDTFCALAALYEYRPEVFTAEVMAKIVTMLTAAEQKEGGPYDMWLVNSELRAKWNDLDLVVNSNVAFFLSLVGISLPNVDAFIDRSIDEEDYEFPYNRSYPGIYFISRFYKGAKSQQMIDHVLQRQEADGKWENPLRTALAVSALINLSGDHYHAAIEQGISYLVRSQQPDGSWPAAAFFFQMRLPQKTLYAGSASTTTALCLEAIGKYQRLKKAPDTVAATTAQQPGDEQLIYTVAVKQVRDRFAACGKDLRFAAEAMLTEIIAGTKGRQVVLLPYYFTKALGAKGNVLSKETITELGAANIFGWMAYTIYDDFLDDEGSTAMLPVANICLRESVKIFMKQAPAESEFEGYAQTIFDMIDDANSWEIANARFDSTVSGELPPIPDFGDYSQLADKSMGHALGPAAILFSLGFADDTPELKSIMQFFKHYIIARQLNDDAHDWEDDLAKGQINAVGAELLRRAETLDRERLKQLFWETVIIDTCESIANHLALAKESLLSSPVENHELLFKLLEPIAIGARRALRERDEAMRFLRAYTPAA